MTAPQVVAQWINMEHYFSAVDNEVYGSGSKIYHNVVGRTRHHVGTLERSPAWIGQANGHEWRRSLP